MVPFGIPQTCVLCACCWVGGGRGRSPDAGIVGVATGAVVGVSSDVVLGAGGTVIVRA